MSKLLTKLFASCLFLLFVCIPVSAQSSTATLSGTIEDENGAVIPGARVTVTLDATAQIRHATTNDSGSFTIPLLPPGEYTVLVEREGFTRVQLTNIVLNVGDQKAVQVQLKVGDVTSTVEVRPDETLITTKADVSTVVDRTFVENMPLNGRSFQSLISLTPGFVFARGTNPSQDPGQFSVNGQRTDANYFTVDGVSANFGNTLGPLNISGSAGAQPALAATGGTNNLVSVDALQEFRIQSSTYAPEFGRTPGAQVQINTRSGTNEFHGVAFDYIRNDIFDANDWFANANRLARPRLRQNDFGGVFSGPVFLPRFGEGGPSWYKGRNRTFFFFSYEGLRLSQPQTVVGQVPSLTVRRSASPFIQPYINAFPLPNGPDLVNAQGQPTGRAVFAASYSDTINLDATSLRLDQNFGSRLTLFGRINYAPSVQISRRPTNLANLTHTTSHTKTFTAGAVYIFSQSVINDVRFNYSANEGGSLGVLDPFGGAVPTPSALLFPRLSPEEGATASVSFSYGGVSNGILVGPTTDVLQSQINLVDSLSVTVGNHQMKAGVDFRQLSPTAAVNAYRLTLIFNNLTLIQNGIASQLSTLARQTVEPQFNNLSLFAQDAWKQSRRLTITYGIRWEYNPPPNERNGNEALTVSNIDNPTLFTFAPRGTRLYQTSLANFAPRFGAAYQLRTKSGQELVLRGGIGKFYAMGSEAISRAYSGYPFDVSNRTINSALPFTQAQLNVPPFPSTFSPPFISAIVYAYVPDIKLPETWQWNLALEQSLGERQTLSASYVAAAGRRLLRSQTYSRINPNFPFPSMVTIFRNGATSDYHALQVQYDRRLSRGLQALASYTWSHAIDEVSSAISSTSLTTLLERGSANFDVRHAFSGAVTYNLPDPKIGGALNSVFRNWSVDGIVRYQSGTPVDLTSGTIQLLDGTTEQVRPDLISGAPLYIDDPLAPGGRRINPAAFALPPRNPSGQFLRQGTLGRNVLRGLPLMQVDLALRREFNLTERLYVQFRAEAFNVLNRPNFGLPDNSINSGTFGKATETFGRNFGGLNPIYQVGGARSLQFALRIGF